MKLPKLKQGDPNDYFTGRGQESILTPTRILLFQRT